MKQNVAAISLFVAIIALCVAGVGLMQSLESQRRASELERFRFLADSELLSDSNKFVAVDPTGKAFRRVDTDNGFFFVSCQDVSPYLDGQKIVLRIGNPLGVRFSGFKITSRWGPRYISNDSVGHAYAKWNAGLKSKEFSFASNLEPGSWNEAELVLPDTPAEQLGYIEVSLATDTISMSAPRK